LFFIEMIPYTQSLVSLTNARWNGDYQFLYVMSILINNFPPVLEIKRPKIAHTNAKKAISRVHTGL
jgi:hypothetical protein